MDKRATGNLRSLSPVPQLRFPKEVNTYCPKCGHHTAHSVTVYKAGKARTMAWGSRRQERRKHGYGGQKFPELKRTAKTRREPRHDHRVLVSVRQRRQSLGPGLTLRRFCLGRHECYATRLDSVSFLTPGKESP